MAVRTAWFVVDRVRIPGCIGWPVTLNTAQVFDGNTGNRLEAAIIRAVVRLTT